jgi:Mg-chelatase subunit ChlD
MGLMLPLALLLSLGVAVVVFAHALRKGQAEPIVFPATRLIVEHAASAKKRQRIEDHALLALRALLVVALSLLAASPFVQCSRLTLTRHQGASISAVLMIDDSASMRAEHKGQSRLSRAVEAAEQLLADAQPGDAFALVLAGTPARILLPSTTDLGSVKDALQSIVPSDRGTDLAGALTLAKGLKTDTADSNQPLILLSDLSLVESTDLDLSGVTIPPIGITEPLSNCALTKATRAQHAVLVEVTCTRAEAVTGRNLQLFDEHGKALGPPTPAHDGIVSIEIGQGADQSNVDKATQVKLSSLQADQISSDDVTYILTATSKLSFAVRADTSKAGVKTSSDTVLQAGLEALEQAVRVQPLSLLPEDEANLQEFAGLLIDDPSGFPPETRNAIESWVKRGGVAAVFLGPAIHRAPLGSNFQPFLASPPSWTSQVVAGTSPDQAGALGPLTTTWNDLGARGRAVLAPEADLHALATFTDGAPLVASRQLGDGLLVVSALPSSVELSDFALRPAYLELLDYLVTQARSRLGSAASTVGQRWRISRGSVVRDHEGHALPALNLAIDLRELAANSSQTSTTWTVEPDRAGAYTITSAGRSSVRFALLDPQEHIAQPRPDLLSSHAQSRTNSSSKVEISREMALVVLVLSVLELMFRLFLREKSLFFRRNLRETRTSTKVLPS